MCKVKSGKFIKNRQDLQNLIVAVIFRQQQKYQKEHILDLVQYYMQGSPIEISTQELQNMILENLNVLYIKNKVDCENGYYIPQLIPCNLYYMQRKMAET